MPKIYSKEKWPRVFLHLMIKYQNEATPQSQKLNLNAIFVLEKIKKLNPWLKN